MYRTKVLILTSDNILKDLLHGFLTGYADKYTVFHRAEFSTQIATYDVVLIDENIIDKSPDKFLAKYSFEVYPCIIYLTDGIDNPEEYTTVKSLAADYLYKNQLSASGLHNCIKYALESRSLRQEISKQQKRYESLFHNAMDAAFFLTPDWKIENANQAFLNLFGVKPNGFQKADFRILVNDSEDFNRLVADFAEDRTESLEKEIKFNRADRKGIFPGHLKISILKDAPIDDNDDSGQGIAGYHGTINNISYKKRLRTIKESSDRIAMTYRLARTLAHEIRNPLTNITLAVNQLEDEVPKNEETELYLGIIERSSKRINTLIDRLLKSSEQKTLKFSTCDIIDMTKLAVDRAKDRAKLLDINLICDFENDSITYFCDSEKLLIAISNLITNALESFNNNPGQVIVGQYVEDGYICIYVEDTGSGMPENEKRTIFDPFFTKKKNGVGLGLTDTLAIISEHHGQIEVDSEPGLGTTFTILLPQNRK